MNKPIFSNASLILHGFEVVSKTSSKFLDERTPPNKIKTTITISY